MPYQIDYACVNIKGGVRESNQDNFYARERYRYGKEKFNDITEGDLIEAYTMVEVPR